ncbi:Protein dopey-2 [Frankliniella fusca]|uniref:Protein dopey-2 n=1 Tax=Frankliniella fusca TaxID=407009 RepID=A0AAE1LN26_9NEOP|nr:Protein dopey-2 [Frankliniella fusca]
MHEEDRLKRRRRQADRALETSQLQNEDNVLGDAVIASDVDFPYVSECFVELPEDCEYDNIDFKNNISFSSPKDIDQESAMQELCESAAYDDMNYSDHLNINENNQAEMREGDSSVENNAQHPQSNSLRDNDVSGHSLCRNESNSDSSDNESNCDSSGSEQCSEEYLLNSDSRAVIEKPNRLENFTLRVIDVSPDVWKIIKGEEEEKTPEEILKTKLASWSSRYKVKRNAVDELLHTLRNHGHPELPACAKTLLKTPRSTQGMVKSLAGGQFWYRGIQTALMKWLTPAYIDSLENNSVVIDIFIDGLCPHKSVSRSIWPIAGCLKGEKEPFVIALWCGCLKEPSSVDEVFDDFIKEGSDLIENGFVRHGKELKFIIRRYIADAPARAFMRQVKGHNAYHSCERCTEPGEWKFCRITYNPNHVNTLRSDETFENQIHTEHHVGLSPLLSLGTKMITQCPLDVMQMAYGHALLNQLDRLCLFLRVYCPSDFARLPRQLSKYKLFKATEWRRLLLYDGFILLQNQIHKEVYECYLLFACGMRILLVSSFRSKFSSDAHELLINFVKRCYSKLGASFVVYNVHHLQHLVSDCNIHGDPEDFSCFKYENHLGQLKSLLLTAGRDLQQLICRLIERSLLPVTQSAEPSNERFYMPHVNRPTLDCKGIQLEAIECVGSVIRVSGDKSRDSFVQVSTRELVVVENIVNCGSSTYIIGKQFLEKRDYFKFPIPSSSLHIYIVSQLGPLEKWNIQEIKQKIVYYSINVKETEYDVHNWREGEGLCLPLLHSEA